jgi:hypothetical protein
MSCGSDEGGVEWPLPEVSRDSVEAVGDRTCVGSGDGDDGFDGGTGGPNVLPLPRIRPPPILRPDIALNGDDGHQGCRSGDEMSMSGGAET